jgi:hypothetical protein
MHIYNWCHSNVTGIHYVHEYRLQYTWCNPLAFFSLCWIPFAPPSNPLYLLGNPPSCDRIRPPWSQVACKLTSPFSTLSPIPPPSKFPEPRVLSASLWRPQESGFFCLEQKHYNFFYNCCKIIYHFNSHPIQLIYFTHPSSRKKHTFKSSVKNYLFTAQRLAIKKNLKKLGKHNRFNDKFLHLRAKRPHYHKMFLL